MRPKDTRFVRRLGSLVVAITATLVPFDAAQAVPQLVVPGFTDAVLASGMNFPTAFALSPDGRLFITEKSGAVRIVHADGTLASEPFVQVPAATAAEKGALGITLHPEFATNGYVYVYWTDPGATSAVGDDFNRITRFSATGDVAGERTEIVSLDSHGPPVHSGGAMHFGPDGKLYVATGDNTYAPNSQGLHTRHGKILRYNFDGSIPTDNPFYGVAQGANRAIWALGLRNPYTFSFGPGGVMHINDVGLDTWEEVNLGVAGANYGWGIIEGPAAEDPDPPPTSPGTYVDPIHAYRNTGNQCAITGSAFYTGTQFPAEYWGDYFFADYCAQWIDRLDGTTPVRFATSAPFVLDFLTHPDGSLLYLSAKDPDVGGLGSVRRVTYGQQIAPSFVTNPADTTVNSGEPATFTAVATGSQPVLYQWQREDGTAWADIAGATSDEFVTPPATEADDGTRFRAVARNSAGSQASPPATLHVRSAADAPPVITIAEPVSGTRYEPGQALALRFSAADPEDGALADSSLRWRVVFHHDQHSHPFIEEWQPGGVGEFTVPDGAHDPGLFWYRVEVEAVDSAGNRVSESRDVYSSDAVDHITPSAPRRLVDTRVGLGATTPGSLETLELSIAALAADGGIPDTASAVSINLTAAAPLADGYLTAWPCGEPQPGTSTVNYRAGRIASAGAFVGLGGGKLCVFVFRTTDVIVDVTGWTDPSAAATAGLVALSPRRPYDSRQDPAGALRPASQRAVAIAGPAGLPAAATGAVVNLTAVNASRDGYLTLWACDAPRPSTSSLNVATGEIRANLALVPLAADGTVCVYASGGAHIVLDVVGVTVDQADGELNAIVPQRLVDTRVGAKPASYSTVTVPVPADAEAVALTVTVVEGQTSGFVTVYPCGGWRPPTSTLNYQRGQIVSNGTITPVGIDGRVCLFVFRPAHVVVDMTGVIT